MTDFDIKESGYLDYATFRQEPDFPDSWEEERVQDPPVGQTYADCEIILPALSSWKTEPDRIEKKFLRLRDQWKAERGYESSTEKLVMHVAYQKIIGMGLDAVPFLLRELATFPDRWYWALRVITEEDPVPLDLRGNSKAMAQAWLEWGQKQGYQW